jgi:hypothetical protein
MTTLTPEIIRCTIANDTHASFEVPLTERAYTVVLSSGLVSFLERENISIESTMCFRMRTPTCIL